MTSPAPVVGFCGGEVSLDRRPVQSLRGACSRTAAGWDQRDDVSRRIRRIRPPHRRVLLLPGNNRRWLRRSLAKTAPTRSKPTAKTPKRPNRRDRIQLPGPVRPLRIVPRFRRSRTPGAADSALRRDYHSSITTRLSPSSPTATSKPPGVSSAGRGGKRDYLSTPTGSPSSARKPPFQLKAGEVVSYRTCGGGGYGPPLERDPALVVAESATRKSRWSARGIYGVAVDPVTWTIDEEPRPVSGQASVMTERRFRLGIDIGGTFTDAMLIAEETGEIGIRKVLSTPSDPSSASSTPPTDPAEERRAARASPTSSTARPSPRTRSSKAQAPNRLRHHQGFRDLFEIARQMRPSLYDVRFDKPKPLVPRYLSSKSGAAGRTAAVLIPLDEEAVRVAARHAQTRSRRSDRDLLPPRLSQRRARAAGRRDLPRGVPGGRVSISASRAGNPRVLPRVHHRRSTPPCDRRRATSNGSMPLRAAGIRRRVLVMQIERGSFHLRGRRKNRSS